MAEGFQQTPNLVALPVLLGMPPFRALKHLKQTAPYRSPGGFQAYSSAIVYCVQIQSETVPTEEGGAAGAGSSPTMTMDGLDTLPAHGGPQGHPGGLMYPHSSTAFLLTESAAAAQHHFNVLSFDACLLKNPIGQDPGSSPVPGAQAAPDAFGQEAAAPDVQPGDLNTPVTTSGDIPSFFPNNVVEPPAISDMYMYHGADDSVHVNTKSTKSHGKSRWSSMSREHQAPECGTAGRNAPHILRRYRGVPLETLHKTSHVPTSRFPFGFLDRVLYLGPGRTQVGQPSLPDVPPRACEDYPSRTASQPATTTTRVVFNPNTTKIEGFHQYCDSNS
ncbi:hypothetical protein FOCC_FOCC008049 [Frankliniella occidentalis]|nr:hypothetical protein FOCC_FOCC008049 [Frankliniella occidentalis]